VLFVVKSKEHLFASRPLSGRKPFPADCEVYLATINRQNPGGPQKLIGNYRGRQECHIEPDWLLICKLPGTEIIFKRTESHSDLFE